MMKYAVVALVSLCAGLGASPILMANVATMRAAPAPQPEPAQETPAEPSKPTRLELTRYLTPRDAYTEEDREQLARYLDAVLLGNGMEVYVYADAKNHDDLIVSARNWTRTSIYGIAKQLDFRSLQRAGFRTVLFYDIDSSAKQGYDVAEAARRGGEALGPLVPQRTEALLRSFDR
jgi:hypothetical protein